jgi:hypothetical protein
LPSRAAHEAIRRENKTASAAEKLCTMAPGDVFSSGVQFAVMMKNRQDFYPS